jgi:shikimate kinase
MAAPASPFDRPISLVGMPGAGKTSVGRLLARRLSLAFHDSDEEVMREAGRTIEQLFSSEGQAAFRERERQVIARLIDAGPGVIATGGGATVEAESRRLLVSRTTTIWLQACPHTLSLRLAGAPPRPLLAGPDLLAKLQMLEAERRAFYGEAQIHLSTDGGDVAATVEAAVAALASQSAAAP